MKTQYGFTLLENIKEIKEYLDKQKPTRVINKLQVHHFALPDYSTWNGADKRVYGNNRELGRTKALDSYGKQTWNYSDGYGHYIAQHFSVFPNGKITTGRHLNSTPVGIKGWNTGAICIEIYGCFDKGKDVMTAEQKQTVIALYSLLAHKFNIPINANGIRPHCWFTAGGTYIGDYNPYKSAKTCPGTNFMSFGNTKKAFENNFYPLVKAYKYGEAVSITPTEETTTNKTKYLRVLEDLNMHKTPDFDSSSVIGVVKAGTVVTIVKEVTVPGCSTHMYLVKAGYYLTASTKYVETFER